MTTRSTWLATITLTKTTHHSLPFKDYFEVNYYLFFSL
jgi:hypothetical protein